MLSQIRSIPLSAWASSQGRMPAPEECQFADVLEGAVLGGEVVEVDGGAFPSRAAVRRDRDDLGQGAVHGSSLAMVLSAGLPNSCRLAALALQQRKDASDVTDIPQMDTAGTDTMGLRDLHTAFEPRSLTDLAVIRAVYRPDHMAYGTPELLVRRKREGDAAVTVHPAIDAALTDLLRESWGVPVFDEQIVAILVRLAGIVPAHAELMRRSMAMNCHADADGFFAALAAGLTARGFPADAAEPLGSFLYEWTPYAFPREHCVNEAHRVLA